MTLTSIALVLVGAFYVFAGIVGTRAAKTSQLMDRALQAISLEPTPAAETLRGYWLVGSTQLVLASGLALMTKTIPALWLFVASAAGQALYLFFLAPYYFDKSEPADPRGRSQTTNAFVIYLAATMFVVWAYWKGELLPVAEASPLALGSAALVMAANLAYVARHSVSSRSKF